MIVLQHRQQVGDLTDDDAESPSELARSRRHGYRTVLVRLYRRRDRGRAAQGHGVNVDETGAPCWR